LLSLFYWYNRYDLWKRKRKNLLLYKIVVLHARTHWQNKCHANVSKIIWREVERERKMTGYYLLLLLLVVDCWKERKTASERNNYYYIRWNGKKKERSQFLSLFYILSSVVVFRFKCKRKVVNLNGMCVVKRSKNSLSTNIVAAVSLCKHMTVLFRFLSYRYMKTLHAFNLFVLFCVHHSLSSLIS
jgi:hypothetical protein